MSNTTHIDRPVRFALRFAAVGMLALLVIGGGMVMLL